MMQHFSVRYVIVLVVLMGRHSEVRDKGWSVGTERGDGNMAAMVFILVAQSGVTGDGINLRLGQAFRSETCYWLFLV